MTSIVLADDHVIMRQGLKSLLEAEPGLQIVGEADNGEETVQLVERLRPDVLVLDMVMPGENGVEVTRRLRETVPSTAVIILSMFGTEGYVHKAMRAGARAYILKQATADELTFAIQEVTSGRRYLSRALSERAIDAYVQETLNSDLDPSLALTNREREVLTAIAGGGTAKEVAARMNISRRTVEFHRQNIKRKLGLHSQQELIRYCLRTGIISV